MAGRFRAGRFGAGRFSGRFSGQASGQASGQGSGQGEPAPGFLRGWDPGLDLGTAGDIYVDAAVGQDSNDGSTPASAKRTISAAMDAAAPGNTIRVRAGTYREVVAMQGGAGAGARTQLLAHGTERPVISAAEILTGLVGATIADQPRVGDNYGAMYRATLAVSDIADNSPRCLNIHEAGVGLNLCIDWQGLAAGDRFFQQSTPDWWIAETTWTTSGNIEAYALGAVTDRYSPAQIENARVLGHRSPNASFESDVAGFDAATGRIDLAVTSNVYEDNANRDRFALLNMLPAMRPGEWGWWDNGDGTVEVYVWPRDPANIAAGIEYSARPHCITLNGASHVAIRGMDCRQSAGIATTRSGTAIISWDFAQVKTDVTIEQCRVSGIYSDQQSGIRIQTTDDCRIAFNTLENLQNSFGVFVSADVNSPLETTVFSNRLDFQRNAAYRVEDSPWRFYTLHDAVVAHNHARACGISVHANKINFYEQCDKVLIWGNVFDGCGGYATHQEASGTVWAFNQIPASPVISAANTSRAFEDQNNATAPPNSYNGSTLDSYLLNNTFLPAAVAIGGTTANAIAPATALAANATVDYRVHNNLYHGHNLRAPERIAAWSDNWNTGPDGVFDPSDTPATPADTWTDPANDDFTIRPGAAVRSASGMDLTTLTDAVLKPVFADRFSGWTLDANGNEFDPAAPPVGAVAGYEYAIQSVPMNITAPLASGNGAPGSLLGVAPGTWSGTPAPSLSWQWRRDGQVIAGATGSQYVTTAADAGALITCQERAVSPVGAASSLSNAIAVAAAGFSASAVEFDGVNDWLYSSALTAPSPAASRRGFVSCWFFIPSLWASSGRLIGVANAAGKDRFTLSLASSGRLVAVVRDANDVSIMTAISATNSFLPDRWYFVAVEWDTTPGVERGGFIRDGGIVLDASTGIVADGLIEGANTRVSVGASGSAGNTRVPNCYLSELFVMLDDTPGDMTIAANREKFRSADGRPVDLGSDGSVPTGNAPWLYLRNPAATWHEDVSGSGNTLTVNGAPGVAPSGPGG